MKRLMVYVDASVVGGCEDVEFRDDSLALWQEFIAGHYTMAVSEHTLRELQPAPETVRRRLEEIPATHQLLLLDSDEATELAEAYLCHGVVGRGSHADALHVALASVGRMDVLVSWNFRHIVNLGRIRMFNSVNLGLGYGTIEIRTPKEVLAYGKEL